MMLSHSAQRYCVDKKVEVWRDRVLIPTKDTRVFRRAKQCGTVVTIYFRVECLSGTA